MIFDQGIIELSMTCESFWQELGNQEQEYNFKKLYGLALNISRHIITIRQLFNELTSYNRQSIGIITTYAMIYRHLLRDEHRFNNLVVMINQIKKNNKLE